MVTGRTTVIGGKYWGQNYKEDVRPATARVVPQLNSAVG